MRSIRRLAPLLLSLATLSGGCATPDEAPDAPLRKPKAERIAWFQEARFGLFLHWGLYSIPAGEWEGATNHAEWIRTSAQIPLETYEQLQPRFRPVQFDADRWVQAAKAAGMRYVVITSKHHDGFCLWNSAETDWDVMESSFQRDVLAELAAACDRHGLRLGLYHSIMDWHHPDYLPRRDWETERPSEGADFARYVDYLHAQVTELLTRYGPIDVMWFDGEWEATWNHEQGQSLYDLCLDLQPDIIVNNRVDVGRGGMAGMTTDARYAGDFGTPEQEVPATGFPGVDWETCMTMNDHWGFNVADDRWKSDEELVRTLVDVASKGGNFLLNVGPTAKGEFPPEALERLALIGTWMERFGESIYGTQASPFEELPFGRATVKRDGESTTLYLQVFEWPFTDTLVVPGLGNEVARAWIVGAPEAPLSMERRGTDLVLRVPATAPDARCTPIALEFDGEPIVFETPRIHAPTSELVRYVEARVETRSEGLTVRYTLDGSDPTVGSPRCTGTVRIDRTCELRARAFHEGRPVSGVASMRFQRVLPLLPTRPGELAPGLVREVYSGDWKTVPAFDELEAVRRDVVALPTLDDATGVEHSGLRFSGFVNVPADEVYTFALESDDGSRLWIGGDLVIDNDGLHGPAEKTGSIALGEGQHPIRVEWFNKTGGSVLAVRWAPLDAPLEPIAATSLGYVKD